MKAQYDLTGREFGRLTVTRFHGRDGLYYMWECECKCGTVKLVNANNLRAGLTKSCGCLRRENMRKNNYWTRNRSEADER